MHYYQEMNEPKKKDKKVPLSPLQLAECQAASAIFQKKKAALNKTQADIAAALAEIKGVAGIGQTGISKYFSGKSAINVFFAIAFARELQVEISEFSPRIASIMGLNPDSQTPKIKQLIDVVSQYENEKDVDEIISISQIKLNRKHQDS